MSHVTFFIFCFQKVAKVEAFFANFEGDLFKESAPKKANFL
jgi:hypothetical protein